MSSEQVHSNRNVKLLIIGGITFVLLLASIIIFLFILPYKIKSFYINRKTGSISERIIFFSIYTYSSISQKRDKIPQQYDIVVAPDKSILIKEWRYPYCWSNSENAEIKTGDGAYFVHLVDRLFRQDENDEMRLQNISEKDRAAYYNLRIKYWNEADGSKSVDAIMEEIKNHEQQK